MQIEEIKILVNLFHACWSEVGTFKRYGTVGPEERGWCCEVVCWKVTFRHVIISKLKDFGALSA